MEGPGSPLSRECKGEMGKREREGSKEWGRHSPKQKITTTPLQSVGDIIFGHFIATVLICSFVQIILVMLLLWQCTGCCFALVSNCNKH